MTVLESFGQKRVSGGKAGLLQFRLFEPIKPKLWDAARCVIGRYLDR